MNTNNTHAFRLATTLFSAALTFIASTGAVTADEAEEAIDYSSIGMEAGYEAFGNSPRPGSDGGYGFTISNPDGTQTWTTGLGSDGEGGEHSPDDLEEFRQSYGNQLSLDLQTADRAGDNELGQEVKDTTTNTGHAYFGNDPAMVHTENALNEMQGDFQDIFSGCKEITSANKAPQETEIKGCYNIEAPVEEGCTMEHRVRIAPVGNQPTAVTILVDKSGSMKTGNRIEAARYSALKVAQLLEAADKTEYSVHAFPRLSSDPESVLGMDTSYPITEFRETVDDPYVASRYRAISANGSTTPFATAADEAAAYMMLNRLPGERKIVMVVTDGEPYGDTGCPNSSPCAMSQVIADYPEVDFVAVGIQLEAVKNYFPKYRVIQNNKEMTSAMYELLAQELNAYIAEDHWLPELCVSTALAVEAGEIEGTLECATPPDENGCRDIDGLYVCEGSGFANDFTSPFNTISEICGVAAVTDVRFCWTGTDGTERCSDDPPDDDAQSCVAYETDQSCGRIESVCVEDSRSTTGQCYLYEEQYACNYDNTSAAVTTDTSTDDGTGTIQCDGQDVACTDDDCLGIPDEENEDFAMVSAMVQMSEEVALDSSECDGNLEDCLIFDGDMMYCKSKAAFGAANCCEDTLDGSYVELAAYSYQAYTQYQAAAAAGSAASAGGSGALSSALGAFSSGVMAAYAVYLAAEAAVAIAADCEEDNQIMYNTKRLKLKACVGHLSSRELGCDDFTGACRERRRYGCCFSSPLARIIQEQVRAQIGKPWGSGSNLDCSGFTLEEFQAIDWGIIDWTEWIDIMYEQGKIPDDADLDARYDLSPHYEDDVAEGSAEADPNSRMEEEHTDAWRGLGVNR